MKPMTTLIASGLMIAGIVAIGLGFWRVSPGVIFIGAALILTGYAVGTAGRLY